MTASLTIVDLDTVSKSTAAGLAACFASIAGVTLAGSGAADVSQAASAVTPNAPAAQALAADAVNAPVTSSSAAVIAPVVATAPSSAATSAADAIAAKYFPANIGLAAFPSPENSSIVRLGALITGQPYLRDSQGNVHQFVAVSDAFPNGYTMNGAAVVGGGSDHSPALSLIVREGAVYVNVGGNVWQTVRSGGLYSATLPDAFITDATGATTSTVAVSTVTVPASPIAQTPAPGTSGATVLVGAGGLATIDAGIKAAKPGDIVRILAGNYKEAPAWWSTPGLHILFDSADAILDCTGLTGSLAQGKGGLVPGADCLIENPYVTGVALDQDTQSTAAIRPTDGCGFLTIKGGKLYKNQFGVAGGGIGCIVDITGTVFDFNGLNNGTSHDMYLSNGIVRFTVNNVTAVNPNGGYPLKSRAFNTIINGGAFTASDAACLDFPDGSVGQVVVTGATLTKPAGANDHKVIRYGEEALISGNGGMLLTGTTVHALCDNPLVDGGSGTVITFDPSCTITGKMAPTAGKVIGI